MMDDKGNIRDMNFEEFRHNKDLKNRIFGPSRPISIKSESVKKSKAPSKGSYIYNFMQRKQQQNLRMKYVFKDKYNVSYTNKQF